MDAKENKPFRTIAEQISYLRNENKLIINNEEKVAKLLKKCNYYNIISLYDWVFRRYNGAVRQYKDSITFEMIYSFYEFDLELKRLFLWYIQKIERHIKTLIAYYFAKMYSEDQRAYYDLKNYYTETLNAEDIARKVISIIDKKMENPEIIEYKNKNNNVPIWVIINHLTFFEMTRLFECLLKELQNVICSEFLTFEPKELVIILKILNDCRNTCAHDKPLYSFCSAYVDEGYGIVDGCINRIVDESKIKPEKNRHLYLIVLFFKHLLNNIDFAHFHKELEKLVLILEKEIGHKSTKEILDKSSLAHINTILKLQPKEMEKYKNCYIDTHLGKEKVMFRKQNNYSVKHNKKDEGKRRHRYKRK